MAAEKMQNKLDELIESAGFGRQSKSLTPATLGQTGQDLADRIMTDLTGTPFRDPVCGYKIALLIMPEKKTTDGGIHLPDSYRDKTILTANAGLCIGLGPDAYPADRYPSGPWVRVGQWAVFQRYATTAALIGYKGVTIAIIPDDKIDMVTADPKFITEIAKRDLL